MQPGVLNPGTIDAINWAPDPKSTNPALYRSTGSLALGTINGVSAVKATATTANTLEIVIDRRYYSDVEGLRVGDIVYWSAEVYVTTPMNVQATVSFYANGNEDTTAAITPQTPADGWVRHYAKSVITAAPAGSYFDYRIRPQQLNIPVGQGFYFRNLSIVKGQEVPYFSGDTPDNTSYTFDWMGTPNNSYSTRRVATSTDVMQYTSRVTVNGITRDVLSWSTGRDITNSLPSQVVGGDGVTQATGQVAWASRDVETGELNPWNPSTGWIPQEGDRVDIYVGDGITEWKQFTGLVDTTSGDIMGGITSQLVDKIDQLSKAVDIPALMTGMPPLTEGGAWRRVGMSSRFTQNTILRKAGFYSTPRPEANCVLDVPMQSSMWPLVGTVLSCSKRSVTSSAPDSYGAPWGTAIGDWTATYAPSTARPAADPVQITLMRTSAHADFGVVRVEYGSSAKSVALQLSSVNSAQALVNGTVVATVPCSGDAIATLLYKNGVVTLKTSAGQSATVNSATGATGNVTQIVTAGGVNSRCAGMQVSHPATASQEFASLSHVPSARVITSSIHAANLILPAVTGVTAREALDEIGSKTLRPMWIDELGVAQIFSSDSLWERSPVQVVTTLDDIRELSWTRDLTSVRSEILVKYLHPIVNSRTTPSVTLWSNSDSIVLQQGDTQEIFIEPDSGTDWVMPDESFAIVGINSVTEVNKGSTSMVAAVVTDGVNESWATQGSPPPAVITVRKLSANRFVVKVEANNVPAGNQVEVRTVSANFVGETGLWPMWWGKNSPILRGNALANWLTMERPVILAGDRGPSLEFDCGPWLSTGGDDTAAIDALGAYIAARVSDPEPRIESMRVGFDPRRQLGDVIIVSSPKLMGVEMKCLIVGVSNSGSESGYTQNLSVQVIEVTSTATTYAEFIEAWGTSANYSSLIAAWGSAAKYSDFVQDPLKGTY